MSSKNAREQLRLIVDGFLSGESRPYQVIKAKITQYVHHQDFGDDVDRDDLVADVLQILYRNLREGKFRGDSLTAFNVYVYNITRYRINRLTRRRKRLSYTNDSFQHRLTTGDTYLNETTRRQMVKKIYESLDHECRELLQMKFEQHLTDQEIADKTGKSRNAVSTAIHRCLKKIREKMSIRPEDW